MLGIRHTLSTFFLKKLPVVDFVELLKFIIQIIGKHLISAENGVSMVDNQWIVLAYDLWTMHWAVSALTSSLSAVIGRLPSFLLSPPIAPALYHSSY